MAFHTAKYCPSIQVYSITDKELFTLRFTMNIRRALTTLFSLVLFSTHLLAQDDVFSKLTPDDRRFKDNFGYAVSASANFAVIGAPNSDTGVDDTTKVNNAGSAYFYLKTGEGQWDQHQKIVASDRTKGDGFGASASISNDYAVIGTVADDQDASGGQFLNLSGSAYFFERNDENNWEEVQKLVPNDRAEEDQFGLASAVQGDAIIVGAAQQDLDVNGGNPIPNAGAAYIFERTNDGQWLQTQKLTAPSRQERMLFGWSVDVNADLAIVGAPEEPGTLNGQAVARGGAAYIFRRGSDFIWRLEQKITPNDPSFEDFFGRAVHITNDQAFVSATFKEVSNNDGEEVSDAGAVYVFDRQPDGTWIQSQILRAYQPTFNEKFGDSFNVGGSYLIVGGHHKRRTAAAQDTIFKIGSTYVFQRRATGRWGIVAELNAEDQMEFDEFGSDVAISGGDAIISAINHDYAAQTNDTSTNAGAVYILNERYFDDFAVSVTSTSEVEPLDMAVFPNPARGRVRISSPEAGIQKVTAYDLTGRQLCTQPGYRNRELEMDLDYQGVVVLRVRTTAGTVSRKVLLE